MGYNQFSLSQICSCDRSLMCIVLPGLSRKRLLNHPRLLQTEPQDHSECLHGGPPLRLWATQSCSSIDLFPCQRVLIIFLHPLEEKLQFMHLLFLLLVSFLPVFFFFFCLLVKKKERTNLSSFKIPGLSEYFVVVCFNQYAACSSISKPETVLFFFPYVRSPHLTECLSEQESRGLLNFNR